MMRRSSSRKKSNYNIPAPCAEGNEFAEDMIIFYFLQFLQLDSPNQISLKRNEMGKRKIRRRAKASAWDVHA
jgi:hypothetical protein